MKIVQKLLSNASNFWNGIIAFVSSQIVLLCSDALVLTHAPLLIKIPLFGLAGAGYIVVGGLLGIVVNECSELISHVRSDDQAI